MWLLVHLLHYGPIEFLGTEKVSREDERNQHIKLRSRRLESFHRVLVYYSFISRKIIFIGFPFHMYSSQCKLETSGRVSLHTYSVLERRLW